MPLNNFTDKDGKLYFFTKHASKKGVMISTPTKLFKEENLYTSIDENNNKDVSLELAFSELEGIAKPVIDKMIYSARNCSKPLLSEEEKEIWSHFFYYQWKRVPDSYNQIFTPKYMQDQFTQAIQDYKNIRRPLSFEEERNLMDSSTRERIFNNARIIALSKPSDQIVDIFMKKGIGVGVIKRSDKSFIIGSFPIVKFTLPNHTHLMDSSVEAWFPIAHDVIVSLCPSPPVEQIIEINETRHIRYINEAIIRQSTIIAGKSKALIKSLSQST